MAYYKQNGGFPEACALPPAGYRCRRSDDIMVNTMMHCQRPGPYPISNNSAVQKHFGSDCVSAILCGSPMTPPIAKCRRNLCRPSPSPNQRPACYRRSPLMFGSDMAEPVYYIAWHIKHFGSDGPIPMENPPIRGPPMGRTRFQINGGL